jgi:hypothetical protein
LCDISTGSPATLVVGGSSRAQPRDAQPGVRAGRRKSAAPLNSTLGCTQSTDQKHVVEIDRVKRSILPVLILSTIILTSCAGTSRRLYNNVGTSDQMKKTELIGHSVLYCYKGYVCKHDPKYFFLVTKQDELSISFENGETILYTNLESLTFEASKSEEFKDSLVMNIILFPAMVVCSIFSNGCWR